MKEFLNKLSGDVIGAAIEVHRELRAVTYELALQHELYFRGISSERQVLLPVRYKDLELPGSYRVNLMIEDSLIVEVKAVEQFIPVHSAQLLTYLKMSKKHLGLLINFHTIQLTDGIKRVVHNFPK